jgi:hypothetical protein
LPKDIEDNIWPTAKRSNENQSNESPSSMDVDQSSNSGNHFYISLAQDLRQLINL